MPSVTCKPTIVPGECCQQSFLAGKLCLLTCIVGGGREYGTASVKLSELLKSNGTRRISAVVILGRVLKPSNLSAAPFTVSTRAARTYGVGTEVVWGCPASLGSMGLKAASCCREIKSSDAYLKPLPQSLMMLTKRYPLDTNTGSLSSYQSPKCRLAIVTNKAVTFTRGKLKHLLDHFNLEQSDLSCEIRVCPPHEAQRENDETL